MVLEAGCLVEGVVAFMAVELVDVGCRRKPGWGLWCIYFLVAVLCYQGGKFIILITGLLAGLISTSGGGPGSFC